MKNNDPYSKYMNQVWEAKDKIHQATRDMTKDEYWAYIHRRCQSFRKKHQAKYVKLSPLSLADTSIKTACGIMPKKPSLSAKLLKEREQDFK